MMFPKNSAILKLKTFLKIVESEISLIEAIIDIPIQDDYYSVSYVETRSTEYNLQTPNNSPMASTILITNN